MKKKKMLVIPQVSCKSIEGKVLFMNDSGIVFLKNMFKEMANEFDIHYAFAFDVLNSDVQYYYMLQSFLACKMIHFDYYHSYTNAKLERLNFNVDFYKKLSEKYNFDYIFVAEPTHVVNIKALFPNAFIITYNSWLAFKNMKEIHLRQFEGMCAADLTLVNSKYTVDEIKRYYHKNDELKNMNIKVMNPAHYVENVKNIKKYDGNELGIIYNHRLSTDVYYSKAFENLCKVLQIVEDKIGYENMPKVYLTNPSEKSINVDLKEYMVVVDLNDQRAYHEFLESNKVLIHLNTFFESEGMWSMSTIESAITGNICLLPKKFGYAEMFSSMYPGYCDDVVDMAERLVTILSNKYSYFENDEKLKYYTGSNVAKHLLYLIKVSEEKTK